MKGLGFGALRLRVFCEALRFAGLGFGNPEVRRENASYVAQLTDAVAPNPKLPIPDPPRALTPANSTLP